MRTGAVFALAMLSTAPAWGDISITDPWARASILAARPVAAYFTIQSTDHDRLIELSAPIAAKVMIHAVEVGGDGISRMRHVKALELPAEQLVTLTPGTMHLMLMGIESKLQEGTSFPITLVFEKAAEVVVEFRVLGAAAAGPVVIGQ